jgi:hypothetical protein
MTWVGRHSRPYLADPAARPVEFIKQGQASP